MKIGDEVRFLDARTKTWHEGTLVALDEAKQTARVDTDDCGGVVDVDMEVSPLFVTHEATANNAKLLPRWQPKAGKEPKEKEARESTETKKTGRNRSPERMAELRSKAMAAPIKCAVCQEDFTRAAPNQKRCPTCQAKFTQDYHHQWHLKKKARLAGKAAPAPIAAPEATAAQAAQAAPVAKHTPVPASAPAPVSGTGWLAFAARHRQIAELAEQIAGLMAEEGGAA